MVETESSQTTTNTGFYRVDPVITAGLVLTNGQSLSGTVTIDCRTFSFGANPVKDVTVLLDGQLLDGIFQVGGITNASFEIDTRLFPSGLHTFQLAIADNSESSDYPDGDIQTLSDPIQVQFDNVIFGVDWTGVVERRLVAIFGTTVSNGVIQIRLTDDLNRVWLDVTNNLANARQSDGTIIVEASQEGYYTGVNEFRFAITVTPTGGSSVSANFYQTVHQRPSGDYGYYMVINQDNTSSLLGTFGRFGANVQQIFDLSADNALYAGQTVMYTVNLNGEIDPFSADKIYPRNDTYRNDFNRVRDSLINNTATIDHPNNVTFLTYFGHGGLNFFGWGPGRSGPLSVQNVYYTELNPLKLTRYNTNGTINYAVLMGCQAVGPKAKIMKALIGNSTGLSYNYYGRHGLWPKFGLGFDKSGKVAVFAGTEPYTPVWNFLSEWLTQTYIQRDGEGWPLYTFSQAFSRAANKNAENLEGSGWFGMAGCTNCYIEEIITGRLRTIVNPGPDPSGENQATNSIRISQNGQTVWQDQPDER